MRRMILAALAALLSFALLAGCGREDEAGGTADAKNSDAAAALEKVEVSGEGAETTVDVGEGVLLEDTALRVLAKGDGPELAAGDYIRLQFVVFDGGDGSEQGSTYGAGIGQPAELRSPATNEQSIQGLTPDMIEALEGTPVGSTVLFGLPGGDGDTSATTLIVMEITDSSRPPETRRPSGEAQTLPAGIPTPILEGDSVSGIDGSAAAPEIALGRHVVIQGSGEEVGPDSVVVADYVGTIYPNGETFDSSFARGEPSVFPLTGVIPCWTQQLAGLTVGTRVVLTCPNDAAYGDQDRGTIKPGDALTFVVDIRDSF